MLRSGSRRRSPAGRLPRRDRRACSGCDPSSDVNVVGHLAVRARPMAVFSLVDVAKDLGHCGVLGNAAAAGQAGLRRRRRFSCRSSSVIQNLDFQPSDDLDHGKEDIIGRHARHRAMRDLQVSAADAAFAERGVQRNPTAADVNLGPHVTAEGLRLGHVDQPDDDAGGNLQRPGQGRQIDRMGLAVAAAALGRLGGGGKRLEKNRPRSSRGVRKLPTPPPASRGLFRRRRLPWPGRRSADRRFG